MFRNRGHLPHLEFPNSTYFVTFRLCDSVPQTVLENWRFDREQIEAYARKQNRVLTKHEEENLKYLYSKRIERYLDNSYGECWLSRTEIASLVTTALKHFDGGRYHLHAWCVMPNHIHVVFTVVSNGFCKKWTQWQWSGCSVPIARLLKE